MAETKEKLAAGGIAIDDAIAEKLAKPLRRVDTCENCACGEFQKASDPIGLCRANPPQNTTILIPQLNAITQQVEPARRDFSGFPMVQRDGYCIYGFKPKKEDVH